MLVFDEKCCYTRIIRRKEGEIMEVNDIPVPALAALKVSKEDKSALFETTVVQTTDNKYIYLMPIRVDGKPVNFDAKGLIKELRIEFAPFEYYEWHNISLLKFVENGRQFLRVKTTTPGITSSAWTDKPITTQRQKRNPLIEKAQAKAQEETMADAAMAAE
jgi:hypothetical protein